MDSSLPMWKKMINLFAQHGKLTDIDIADMLGAKDNSVRPRRLDLERMGLIRNTGIKIKTSRSNASSIYEFVRMPDEKVKRRNLSIENNVNKFIKKKKNNLNYDNVHELIKSVERMTSSLNFLLNFKLRKLMYMK